MDIWNIPIRLLISFLLGAVIGIEREINEKKVALPDKKPQAILGLRSFSITTSLGTLVGLLHDTHPDISLLIGAAILLLFIVFYVVDTVLSKDTGITTELAMIYSFFIGLLLALETFPIQLTIALTVVLTFILSRKHKIKDAVGVIKRSELNAFTAYAIIALVVLPFLPNRSFSLSDIKGIELMFSNFKVIDRIITLELFNPFSLWLIVALITGIDIIGYILERLIDKRKGWILTSVVGGFVSSTATVQSLAQESKHAVRIHHLLAASLLANIVSFVQIGILLFPINSQFVLKLLPTFFSIICMAGILTLYFLKTKEKNNIRKQKIEHIAEPEHPILQLNPALRFATIYLCISLISKIVLEFYGSSAFLFTTAIGALAGLDAVMINTAQLAGGRLDITTSILAFIIANGVNLGGKAFYCFLQGKKEFAIKFGVSVGTIIMASFLSLFFI